MNRIVMTENLAFSVIVPTAGRPSTLASAVKTVLCQEGNDFEVLVSDNDRTQDTARIIASIEDPRLRYIKTPRRFSMTKHWNFALSQARGRYVMILGDDDGLVPNALQRARHITEHHLDADIIYGPMAFFQWPTQAGPGHFTLVPAQASEGFVDLREILARVLYFGGARWEELPSVYRAFVSGTVLAKIASILNGSFTDTLNPDMFNGFAIACLGDVRAYRTSAPLAICGTSYDTAKKKMPRLRSSKDSQSELVRQHLIDYDDLALRAPLPKEFPRILNSFTETILVALERFQTNDGANHRLNLSAHYAWIASWSRAGGVCDFWHFRDALRKNGFSFPRFLVWYIAFRLRHMSSPLIARIHISRKHLPTDISDIYEAAMLLAATQAGNSN